MRGLRIAVVLTGLGALVTCGSVRARVVPEPPVEETSIADRSAPALALLEAAATAAQSRPWTGTQRVLSYVTGAPVVTETTVQHGPGQHSAMDALDARLFSLLAAHYELTVTGAGRCDGRPSRLVEARRPSPDGRVAARFWVDDASGLLLRREVVDDVGSLLRRSDLVGIRFGTSTETVTSGFTTTIAPLGERLDAVGLQLLEADGWPVQHGLVGGFDLYDTRWLSQGVLQLAYSDGLSTLSLFVQRGELPATTSGVVRRVGDGLVWEVAGEPERVVWAAGGFTWTLVADVAPAVVDEVLLTLPHDSRHATQDGVAPRVWRGMSRVGAWLNPFH